MFYEVDYDKEFFFFWFIPPQYWPAFDNWAIWYNYFMICIFMNFILFVCHYFGETND